MNLQNHLTQPDQELGDKIKATVPGMAFWAGTGPQSTTCATCKFFNGTTIRSGIGVGDLNDGTCAEYRRIVKNTTCRRAAVLTIPPNTPSCRYYAEKPKAKK